MCHLESKNNPDHEEYIKILRRMTPEEKLNRLYLERIEKCHNRNY